MHSDDRIGAKMIFLHKKRKKHELLQKSFFALYSAEIMRNSFVA